MSFGTMQPFYGSLEYKVGFHLGVVSLDSSGDVSSENLKGVTVEHSGTGEYTFTVAKPGASLLCVMAQVEAASAVDLVPQVKSASSSSVVVNLLAGATPTNPSAACKLHVLLVSKDSNL